VCGVQAAIPVLDWRVALFTMAIALGTAIVFGLLPALQTSKPDLAGTLKQAWGNEPVSAKVINISPDQLVHRGWSMDYQALPPAEVFDASLIEGGGEPCTYVAFRTDGILLEAARDLETEARRRSVEQFRQSALDQGILAEAGENARPSCAGC
jgi:hypothetical protein